VVPLARTTRTDRSDTRARRCATLPREASLRGSAFDEIEFFRAIDKAGARALLIGRRALAILGLPVLTADYDFWVHIDDLERFNEAAASFELLPTKEPEQARRFGRYRLENDELVDVLAARSVPTVDGVKVTFDEVWARRRRVAVTDDVGLHLPCLDDLILTKRFGGRPKDAEDIRLLETLRGEESA
jgi:hypothetical protein